VCDVILWWVWALRAFGFFLFGRVFLLAFLFCLAAVKYTSSLHSMLMKWQGKNCVRGLINVEDGETVCKRGEG